MYHPRFVRLLTLALAGVLVFATLLLVACGGGGGGDDEETPTAGPTEEAEETPDEPQAQSVQVNESFWHGGWKVTLGEARLLAGDFGILELQIDATFENLSLNQGNRFAGTLVLRSGGNNYTDTALSHDNPFVDAGLSGDGIIAFQVDEGFDLDDATLVIGAAGNQKAVVPIGPNGDDLVSLEPVDLNVSGMGAAGPVAFELTGAELRADIPEVHREQEEGTWLLTVTFNVTPGAGIQIGQGVLISDNVSLRLPDGSLLAVRDDGRSGPNEVLQGKEGTTISDLVARFDIREPLEGDYALVVAGNYGPPSGGDVQGQAPFSITTAPPTAP